MPANIPAPFIPDFVHASQWLGTDSVRDVPRMTATRLEGLAGDEIVVRYHATIIVRYFADGHTEIANGGFSTETTKRRLNAFTRVAVFADKRVWRVAFPAFGGPGFDWEGSREFVNGMTV